MIHRLNTAELRVLGSLIEKQRTTPEQYPLTLNALRLACNQTTNRDPVLQLDESQVRAAAQSLGLKDYARLATGPGSRTAKYRQLFQEALDLLPAEVSILAVLMLRGPQTVAELKARTARLHAIDDPLAVLERLSGKELVRLLPRAPGQREERWDHLLGEPATAAPPEVDPAAVIETYNDAWNRHDLDAICALHAPGMVFENHTAGERAEGDDVRSHIASIFANWPDLRFDGRTLYVGGDFVVCEWTAHATHPNGTALLWEGVDLFPLRNGLILRKDVYSNASRRVAEQLAG